MKDKYVVILGAGRGSRMESRDPDHSKVWIVNGDGTYTISLDVTGDADKIINYVNVIVIVDRSGSMDQDSGTTAYTYTPTNDNGDPRYGLIDGEFVELERRGNNNNNRTYW